MHFQGWILGVLLTLWISLAKCEDGHIPAIAMVCGKNTQHRDLSTGEWITDVSGDRDCLSDLTEMLHYCGQMYPDLTIVSVKAEDKREKIMSWCSLGNKGPKCKGHGHTVTPIRCVVDGPDNTPALVVDPECQLESLYNNSLCKGRSYWMGKASEKCNNLNLEWNDEWSAMKPCSDPHRYHGAQFVCCPSSNKNADIDPVCLQPRKVGLCRAAFDAWYYDSKSGSCQHFIYGGCGGNENNFDSLESCVKRCPSTSTKLLKDPLLSVPLLTGLGPVTVSDDTSTDPTPTTTTSQPSTTRNSQASNPYFDAPLDPDNEHDIYVESRMQEMKTHQTKLAKATRDWDEAKDQLLKSGASKAKHDQLDEDYHSTVEALVKEHKQKLEQLLSLHQARVDAFIVTSRQFAFTNFTKELDSKDPVVSHVLRTFKHYLKSEQRDQKHIIRHFNMDLESGSEYATLSQPRLQARLDDIQDRVNNALSLAHAQPDLYAQVEDRLNELKREALPLVTLELSESDDATNDDIPEELEGQFINDGPIKIDDGGLPAETLDDVIQVGDGTYDNTDGDDEVDEEDDFVAVEMPIPLNPANYQLDDEISDDKFLEEGDVDIKTEIDINMEDIVVDTPAMVYYQRDRSDEMSWLAWFGIVASFVLVLLVVFGSVRMVRARNIRRRQFARVQVDDHLTAEEKQLLQMQQNGYENPTYKFFEKQQLQQA